MRTRLTTNGFRRRNGQNPVLVSHVDTIGMNGQRPTDPEATTDFETARILLSILAQPFNAIGAPPPTST